MATKDPYMINPEEVKDIKKNMKISSFGCICPRANKQIGSRCPVCESIKPFWNFPKGSPKRDIAVSKAAKVNFFANVVLSSNKEKSFLLEMGRRVGNEIIDGIENQGWIDIAHPKAGKGRELVIAKSESGGYNTYKASPSLDKATWDISDEILDNLVNLDSVVDMIRNGELVEDENYIKISSLKVGESMRFRLCPPAKDAKYFKRLAWVYRHYGGVAQDEIDGIVPVNLTIQGEEEEVKAKKPEFEKPPWEVDDSDAGDDERGEPARTTTNKPQPVEKCFGMEKFFDNKDPQCKACKDYAECKAVILGR
jgi:hypothetical protein